MEGVLELVRKVAGFVILSGICLNLLGGKDYRKYASVLVGLLMILLVITSLSRLFEQPISLESWKDSEYISDNGEWKASLEYADEAGRNAMLSDYELVLEEQIKEVLERSNLSLVQVKYQWMDTGELKGIRIEAIYGEVDDSLDNSDSIQIDQIQIDAEGDIKVKENNPTIEAACSDCKERLASLYRLSESSIWIQVR